MIFVSEVFRKGCPLCDSVRDRLKGIEREHRNIVVEFSDFDKLEDWEKDNYVNIGIVRVPFILVNPFVKDGGIITDGFTPKKLKEQIEKISGLRLRRSK